MTRWYYDGLEKKEKLEGGKVTQAQSGTGNHNTRYSSLTRKLLMIC